MDKVPQDAEIASALRQLTERRDRALTRVPALSAMRRAVLADFLVRQFLLEAALQEAAAKRDLVLHRSSAKIPLAVESILQNRLGAAAVASGHTRGGFCPPSLRSPLTALFTGCALVAVALLGVNRWEALRHSERNVHIMRPAGQSVEGMDSFTRTVAIRPFDLNTNEPASLQASFLSNSRIRLADGNDTPFALRLDVPARAALLEDGMGRTP